MGPYKSNKMLICTIFQFSLNIINSNHVYWIYRYMANSP